MKQKVKPESKIPTTGKNTNQKKKTKKAGGGDLGGSLLKMNEFTLIIIGALVVTVLVFFLFFRSPDPGGEGAGRVVERQSAGQENLGLEKRIAQLEVSMARVASSPLAVDQNLPDAKGLSAIDQRVTRLETATTLKLDAVLERLSKLEKKMAGLKRVAAAAPAKAPKPVVAVPKKAPIKKKAVQSKKKANIFHTVKKGETIWSISQKYKTSVAAIRKLNNFSAKDKIYPGNNILVR